MNITIEEFVIATLVGSGIFTVGCLLIYALFLGFSAANKTIKGSLYLTVVLFFGFQIGMKILYPNQLEKFYNNVQDWKNYVATK